MPKIKKINGNIVTLSGKYKYEQNQYFKLSKDTRGFVLTATELEAKLLVIGDPSNMKVNSNVTVMKDQSIVNVDKNWYGKIITPFGEVIHPISSKDTTKIIGKGYMFKKSPSIIERVKLSKPLDTGLISIDSINPIGLGQRQLIIGDRSTGKSSIAASTIINQRNSKVKTIYVAIGQKRSSVIKFFNRVREAGAEKNTIVIHSAPDSSAQQFLAPSIGMTIAEVIAYSGEDVVIIFDDLSKHANIYREISLSVGKNPGREAYPTDIFYQHSFLLERAGQFINNKEFNGGSITALPIIQTVQEDIASLIPTNIISITDGQIFTSAEMFNKGIYPAVNLQLSVSRTGSSVQSKEIKISSKGLKAEYSKLFEISKFSEISVDMSTELKKNIDKFSGIQNLLMQFGYYGYSRSEIIMLTEIYRADLLSNIKSPKTFSIAFKAYLEEDRAAKKIAAEVKAGNLKNIKNKKIVEVVFGPLTAAASNEFGGLVSSKEYEAYKEVK